MKLELPGLSCELLASAIASSTAISDDINNSEYVRNHLSQAYKLAIGSVECVSIAGWDVSVQKSCVTFVSGIKLIQDQGIVSKVERAELISSRIENFAEENTQGRKNLNGAHA